MRAPTAPRTAIIRRRRSHSGNPRDLSPKADRLRPPEVAVAARLYGPAPQRRFPLTPQRPARSLPAPRNESRLPEAAAAARRDGPAAAPFSLEHLRHA
jgi:hypothetical protein